MKESLLYLDKNDIWVNDIVSFMKAYTSHPLENREYHKYIKYRSIYKSKVKGYRLKWKEKNNNLLSWIKMVEILFKRFYGISIKFTEDDDGIGYNASTDYFIKTFISVKDYDKYFGVLKQRGLGSFFGYLYEKRMIELDGIRTENHNKEKGERKTMSKEVKDDNLNGEIISIMDCAIVICENIECKHCPVAKANIFDFQIKEKDVCCEALAEWIRAKGISEFNILDFLKNIKFKEDNSSDKEKVISNDSENKYQIQKDVFCCNDKFNIIDFIFSLQRRNSSIIKEIRVDKDQKLIIYTILGETIIIQKSESNKDETIFSIDKYYHAYPINNHSKPKTLMTFFEDFGLIRKCNYDPKNNIFDLLSSNITKTIYLYNKDQMKVANNDLFDNNPFLISDPYSIMERSQSIFHYKNIQTQYSYTNNDCSHIECGNNDCDHCIIIKCGDFTVNRELKIRYNKEKERWEIVTCENMYDALVDLYLNDNIKIEYQSGEKV